MDIKDYHVCGTDIIDLFQGEEVSMHDGQKLHANFATEK